MPGVADFNRRLHIFRDAIVNLDARSSVVKSALAMSMILCK